MSLLARWHRWRWDRQQKSVRQAARARLAAAPGTYLDPSAQILGCDHVQIGHHTTIGEDCWLNVNDRTPGAIGIRIGNNCFIGRRNFFNSGALIELSDYVMTGLDCHFHGSDHVIDSPFTPYLVGGNTLTDAIRLGANCWLGASVSVLKGVTIGHGSVIGAGAVVTRSVPPFSLVVGNPGRLLRRFDPQKSTWVPAAELTPEAEGLLPTEESYLTALREKWPAIESPRIAATSLMGDL